MAIFGRMAARQRLRRATRESLAIPAFSSPIDCTPWVTGGLWPAELTTITAETATLAEYLKADLQRIANGANDELKALKRAGLTDPARQAAEARVIDEARARAVRRVESTIRYLRTLQRRGQASSTPPPALRPSRADLEKTQVLPAVGEVAPVAEDVPVGETAPTAEAPAQSAPEPPQEPVGGWRRRAVEPDTGFDETQVIPVITEENPVEEPVASGRHHAVADEPVAAQDEPGTPGQDVTREVADLEETQVIPAVTDAAPPFEAPAGSAPEPAGESAENSRPPALAQDEKPATPTRFDNERLNRLLEFVVRQEPRLNWAIGDRADGTTILVTDLAHGWIPSGISLPAGVRLLAPERRTGRVAALVGETTRVVTYTPGDSLRRSADFAATRSSGEPRHLPAIDDLAAVLSEATRGRTDLPKIVARLADAAAAGTFVVDQEVDVLRVHLDTARYQLLVQYPNVNPALLLKCLLMAATEGIASGDSVSANYHLAWYQKLAAAPSNG